ncbi:DUF7561 family protein [Haloglomus halophilum]|uniref:DUF7561 family protein n=1 Tax=Haloglomus halophilum TaxID=2962672 RepID=UPI0020C94421|nr:hypothetical protein [Haloglomus halophilum]
MTREPCDGCGRSVQIAGGIANLWSFGGDRTEGLTLELADGSEFLLCYDCIERLPDDHDVTAEDVAALPSHEDRTSSGDDGGDEA